MQAVFSMMRRPLPVLVRLLSRVVSSTCDDVLCCACICFISRNVLAAAFASGTLLQVALEELQSPQSDPDNFRAGGQLAGLLKTSSAPRPSVFGNMSFNSCGESQMELLVVQVQMLEKEGRQVRASVVLPAHYASDVPLVYPAPSWATRLCQETTARCSGHGTCSAEGNCECQPNYYGLLNPSSCDSQCAVSSCQPAPAPAPAKLVVVLLVSVSKSDVRAICRGKS